jgi:hypothetical protein
MTRATHATTASGDAVTLEASAEQGARGRSLAQLEHNAMQALGLVRAALVAVQAVGHNLDRASLMLSRSQGAIDPGLKPELKRVIASVTQQVNTASHAGHSLLDGNAVAFALDDPWLEASEPLGIDLPDLTQSVLGKGGLSELDLIGTTSVNIAVQRIHAAQSAVREGQRSLSQSAQALSAVLARLHEARGRSAEPRNQDDGFIAMIGRVRDQVLRSGSVALRVQGAPSTRAAWLVEASDERL